MPLLSSTGLKVFLRTRCPLVSYHWSNLDQNGMPLVIGGWERDVDRGWGWTSRRSCLRILFQGIKPYVVQVRVFTWVLTLFFCQGRPFIFSNLAFFIYFFFSLFFVLALTFAWIALSGFQSSGLLSGVVSLYLIKVKGILIFHLPFDREITRVESSASAFNSIAAWSLMMHNSYSVSLLVTSK